MDIKKIIGQSRFAQVGFVVNDIEKTKKQFAILFGCEVPPTCDCGTFDVTQTRIFDQPHRMPHVLWHSLICHQVFSWS